MPVWHETTKAWVKQGKLAILGVTQEQHPERCRLFAQWKQLDWPILHDPINILGLNAVPVLLALDEHGIVRMTRPNPKTFEAEFLNRSFVDDATNSPRALTPTFPVDFAGLKRHAEGSHASEDWRKLGDALALWGSDDRLNLAIEAYRKAITWNAKDGDAWFRLGVCLRRRSESTARERDDFRAAIESWGTALDLDPNQYIWRRRIQQYGPRLDKPYPFYDWVGDAEAAIRSRGEKPVVLPVRPDGSEIAQPAKSFAHQQVGAQNPDPHGRIQRDTGSVSCETVIVPANVKAAQSVRVHLTFRLSPNSRDHWNNEAEPLRLWIDPPEGVRLSARLIEAEKPRSATSREVRTVGFEAQIPGNASGVIRIPVYALYHLCEDAQGECRFVRLDTSVEIKVK